MPSWPAIVVPALFLACLLAPLALSLRETHLDPPRSGGDPDGGVTPTPPLPTQSDGASVSVDAVEVDVSLTDEEPRRPSREIPVP